MTSSPGALCGRCVSRKKDSGKVYRKTIDSDTRYWFADEVHVLNLEFEWPEPLEKGAYELFLNLPDASPSLYQRPEYAIRLASTFKGRTIWEADTGWNLLVPHIEVL